MISQNYAIVANVVLQLLTAAQQYQTRLASGVPIADVDVDAALALVAKSRAQLVADIAAAEAARPAAA